jgi:hypothetical protein
MLVVRLVLVVVIDPCWGAILLVVLLAVVEVVLLSALVVENVDVLLDVVVVELAEAIAVAVVPELVVAVVVFAFWGGTGTAGLNPEAIAATERSLTGLRGSDRINKKNRRLRKFITILRIFHLRNLVDMAYICFITPLFGALIIVEVTLM